MNEIELPLLTFNSLYNLLRQEKKTKTLQKLPELFYEAKDKFIVEKLKNIEKLKNNDDKEKLKKEKNLINSSEKIINELLSIRAIKIANIAIKNELFEEEILSKNGIIKKEEEFLEVIKKATKIFK